MKEQRKPLSARQIKIVQGKLEGKKQIDIGREAYPDATPVSAAVLVARELKKENVQEALQEAFVNNGLDINSIVGVVTEASKANRVAQVEGDFYETTVPDHGIRLRAVGMAAQFMGIGKQPGDTNINFNITSKSQRDEYQLT